MATENLSRAKLVWSGEHWINYLRTPGSAENSGMVSLYRAYYSPAGRGTVAYIDVPGAAGFTGVCTDNRDCAQFIDDRMIRGNAAAAAGPWARELPLVEARFHLAGDVGRDPAWTIEAGETRITAAWKALQEPLVGPPTIHPHIIFTIFFFADRASIEVNGRKVSGEPYPNEAWARNLGEPHSSCVFALAETMIEGG